MILAQVPEWVQTLRDSAIAIGAVCGALLTIAAATKLPLVNRPIHWMWRQFVSEPLDNWFGRVLAKHAEPDRVRLAEIDERLKVVEHEVRTNDGQSLRDVNDRVERMTLAMTQTIAPHAVEHRPAPPE